MTIWEYVGFCIAWAVLLIVSNLAWVVVHEFAHLIVAKLTCGVSEWEMKVWPCKLDGRKVGGYVRYWAIKRQTKVGQALVSLAPFMVSTLACIILPIAVMTKSIVFVAIMLAGLIDQVGGSTVEADPSWDLPSASKNLNVPLWIMRVCSLSIVLASAIASVYIFVDMIK